MKKDKGLKRLILAIRKSKTAAEERKIIEQEKASIRADISDAKLKPFFKCLNVSKLILIDMLGYDSSFASFECIKLACSENYTHKRIGYLGISCLCTKSSDLILLCTCQMQKDMSSDNVNIISIALLTVASLGNPNILMALQSSILGLFTHKESFIRFRAIGAAIALIRLCPETIPDVLSQINESYMESSSTVFKSVIVLFTEIMQITDKYKEQLHLYVSFSCGYLSRLTQMKNAEGLLDPLGIVYFLKFLAYFAGEIGGEPERILLDVSKSLTSSTKNTIKYEVAHVFIKCRHPVLSRMGNIILQSFINSPHSNLKFCGLKICSKIADWDPFKVKIDLDLQSCLNDPNNEVRVLALNLSFKLITPSNIQQVLKTYLNCLMSVDPILHQSIVEKIADSLNVCKVDSIWHLDTVIRVSILTDAVPELMIFQVINLIRNTPEIQEYSVKKLFYALKSGFRQESLVNIALWTIGEHPMLLEVIELDALLEKLAYEKFSNSTMMYLANMAFKVAIKVGDARRTCCFVLDKLSFVEDLELQQRTCEYLAIITEVEKGSFASFYEGVNGNFKI